MPRTLPLWGNISARAACERADALRRECEPYSATALQSKVESNLMVYHAKKATQRDGFAFIIKDFATIGQYSSPCHRLASGRMLCGGNANLILQLRCRARSS